MNANECRYCLYCAAICRLKAGKGGLILRADFWSKTTGCKPSDGEQGKASFFQEKV